MILVAPAKLDTDLGEVDVSVMLAPDHSLHLKFDGEIILDGFLFTSGFSLYASAKDIFDAIFLIQFHPRFHKYELDMDWILQKYGSGALIEPRGQE